MEQTELMFTGKKLILTFKVEYQKKLIKKNKKPVFVTLFTKLPLKINFEF